MIPLPGPVHVLIVLYHEPHGAVTLDCCCSWKALICQLQTEVNNFVYELMIAIDDTLSKLLILYEQIEGLPGAADTDKFQGKPCE